MSNFETQMDAVLAQNNINAGAILAPIGQKAIVVALHGSEGFATSVLPADFHIVFSSDDVPTVIDRVVSDEAFFVANLRAVALYLQAKFAGTPYDSADVTSFYEAYKTASAEDQVTAQIGTQRLLNELITAETKRAMEKDGKPQAEIDETIARVNASFEDLIAEIADCPIGVGIVYVNTDPTVGLLVNLAQTIHKADGEGLSVEEARDINRRVGGINKMMLQVAIEHLTGPLTEKTMQHVLPADQFEIIDALLQREVTEQAGFSSVH